MFYHNSRILLLLLFCTFFEEQRASVATIFGASVWWLQFLEIDLTCFVYGFVPFFPLTSFLLQVERLQALYTIQVMESLVCLECTVERSRNSSMLTLPLPLFDMDSKPLKTLVRDFFW